MQDHRFSKLEPLAMKLAKCVANFHWQIDKLGGWSHKHWDPGPYSRLHEAPDGCEFNNKDADFIADKFDLGHFKPQVKYLFVLRLALFFEPWVP